MMSADKLQLNGVDNHRLLELALLQTSKAFEDCLSANAQVPLLRLSSECG
jgi:hypothetical protein